MARNRRRFIEALGVGAVGSLAGCSGDSGGSGDSGDSGDSGGSNGSSPTVSNDGVVEGSDLNEYETIKVTANSHSRSSFPLRVEYSQMAEDAWRNEIGLNVSHNTTEQAYENAVARDYDIYITAGWGGRPERIDPDTFITAFKTAEPGGLNWAGYSNEEYDKLVEQQKSATDKKKRQEYVYKAQEILAEDQPVIFMAARSALSATNMDNWGNYKSQIGARPYTHVWNFESIEPKNQKGNSVVLAATRDPDSANPMAVQQTQGTHLNKLIYDRLVRIGPDGEARKWAASEWTFQDAKTVDITLRDGMTFHDGEPVTPEDVKFTIEYLNEWQVPYLASFYDPIESVEVRGDNVVRFNLGEPYVAFISISLTQIGILPKHVWDGVVEENNLDHPGQWSDFNPVGSGPFQLEYFEVEDRAELSTYGDHFSDISFDSFVWRMYGGNSQAMGSVEQGSSSYMEFIQPTQYNRAQEVSNLKAQKSKYHGWSAIYMNNERRPFNDRAFRIALSHIVNKSRVKEIVFNGLVDMLQGPIPPAAEYWHNPDLTDYSGGASKAEQVLKDAGYRWDPDGNLLMPKEG